MIESAMRVVRVPPNVALSPQEEAVSVLVGLGQNYTEIAEEMRVKRRTAKSYADSAASKIPGDMPTMAKLMAWSRGASLDVLEGRTLRFEVMYRGHNHPRLLAVAGGRGSS